MQKQLYSLLILGIFVAGCRTASQPGQPAKRRDNYTYFQASSQYRDSVQTDVYGAPQLLDRILAFSDLWIETRKLYFSVTLSSPFVPHRWGLIA